MDPEKYDFLVKCAVIGDSGVGKSSLISRYCKGEFSKDFHPTVGIEFTTILDQHSNGKIKYQIWDASGNEKYSCLLEKFFENLRVIFLVYDISDVETFKTLSNWKKSVKANSDTIFVLVANKCDLKSQVSDLSAKQFMMLNNIKFFLKVSAKTGKNVEKLFKFVSKELNFTNNKTEESPKCKMCCLL